MNNTLEMIAIFVAVVGGFKAVEWCIEKITNQHDKSKQIDKNDARINEIQAKTDMELAEANKKIANAHQYAQTSLDNIKKELISTLEDHREEYIKGINDVKESVSAMNATYQQALSVIEIKIDNLEKKQDKHNSLIERMYKVETDLEVVKEKQSVANHRIDDLEKKE